MWANARFLRRPLNIQSTKHMLSFISVVTMMMVIFRPFCIAKMGSGVQSRVLLPAAVTQGGGQPSFPRANLSALPALVFLDHLSSFPAHQPVTASLVLSNSRLAVEWGPSFVFLPGAMLLFDILVKGGGGVFTFSYRYIYKMKNV